MLALFPLAMELVGMIPQGVKLGMDLSDVASRTVALYKAPTPATQEELQALKSMIDDEKAKLDKLTAELDKDP